MPKLAEDPRDIMRPRSVWARSSVCQCLTSLAACHVTSITFFLTECTIERKAISGSASISPDGFLNGGCGDGLRSFADSRLVGHLYPQKNFATLARAIARVKNT